ncbi:MAG: hypothetical protein EXS49_01650 [Candidatus Pacebacteria bacterium]|nr:hypothetical protein [Candidatus Paceibacterota bacterium]
MEPVDHKDRERQQIQKAGVALNARMRNDYRLVAAGIALLICVLYASWTHFWGDGWIRKVTGVLSYLFVLAAGLLMFRLLKDENKYIEEERDRIDKCFTDLRDL